MKKITISIFAREELKARFEEAYQNSEMNSKGEFLGAMLETYLNPEPGPPPENSDEVPELRADLLGKDQEIADLREEIQKLRTVQLGQQAQKEAPRSVITLQTTPQQRDILAKCYDDQENLGGLIVQDLVKMAIQWIQVERGGLFSNDRYTRLFTLKGITPDMFQEAFDKELTSIKDKDLEE